MEEIIKIEYKSLFDIHGGDTKTPPVKSLDLCLFQLIISNSQKCNNVEYTYCFLIYFHRCLNVIRENSQ